MSPSPIILVGAGGHARSCIDVIEQSGSHDIAGLVALPNEVGSQTLGYEVLGTDAAASGGARAAALPPKGRRQDRPTPPGWAPPSRCWPRLSWRASRESPPSKVASHAHPSLRWGRTRPR